MKTLPPPVAAYFSAVQDRLRREHLDQDVRRLKLEYERLDWDASDLHFRRRCLKNSSAKRSAQEMLQSRRS